jgi:hypothetical protein
MDRIGACGASDTGSTPVGRTKKGVVSGKPRRDVPNGKVPVSKTGARKGLRVRLSLPPQRKNIFSKAELHSTLLSRLNLEQIYYVMLFI